MLSKLGNTWGAHILPHIYGFYANRMELCIANAYVTVACSGFPKNAKNACAESLGTLCGWYN